MSTATRAALPSKTCLVMRLNVAFGLGISVLVVGQAVRSGTYPPGWSVLACVAFVIWSNNFSANLADDFFVSSDLMVVMVAIAAFNGHGSVLAAAAVGASGGVVWQVLSNPERTIAANLLVAAFNCFQMSVAATAAAVAYGEVSNGHILWVLVGGAGATVAYTVVNLGQLGIAFVANGTPKSTVLEDFVGILPNFLAFGILGVLIGQLYSMLHLVSLVLLIVPSLIARSIYRSALAQQQARDDTISVFMKALEAKDVYTARHTHRVARYSRYIGEAMGLRGAKLTHLYQAALMHDIGKMAVSSQLLNKPGRLTEEEYSEIRRHNEVCVGILTQVAFLRSTIPVAQDRHGFFNEGAGRRDLDALEGFIVAVADAFDAMTSTRAYRKALTQEVAFAELRKGKGKQFDPSSVEALIASIEKRGEVYGAGYEVDIVEFEVEPPVSGVGSAGLGDLEPRQESRQSIGMGARPFRHPFRVE
jgi:hypothetical protein